MSAEPRITARISFLRRRFLPERKLFCGPVAVVPLLNIVLLLVLFLVINSAFVLQPGVMVNLPTSSFASGAHYGAMVVLITQEGMVFFNDEQTTVERLKDAFSQLAFERPDIPLIIEADGRVRHSTIIDIYNMAMSVGIQKVLLATRVSSAPTGDAQ